MKNNIVKFFRSIADQKQWRQYRMISGMRRYVYLGALGYVIVMIGFFTAHEVVVYIGFAGMTAAGVISAFQQR
jgi:hypothetical protein